MVYLKRIISIILIFIISINNVDAKELDCDRTLKRGNSGEKVKILQKRLNQVMDCNLEVDGVFGRKTYACVVRFEERYDLEIDGVVGKETCSMLNEDLEEYEIDEDSKKTEISDGNYLIVIKDNTAIYSSPSIDSDIIDEASFGKIYNYTDNSNSWYEIESDDGEYGYIKKSKVRTSFIMVDISEQRLIYLKNKELILDTHVVTGMNDKHDTPTGYYIVKKDNKQKERTLRGTNDNGTKYAAYVDYWMPFITSRGIGFHDASWRDEDEFNDSTYIYDGSHGCVNMPFDAAKTLYKAITYDEDVIIRN